MRPRIGDGSGGTSLADGVIEAQSAGLDVVRMDPFSRLDVGGGKADRLSVFSDRRSTRDVALSAILCPISTRSRATTAAAVPGDVDRGARRNPARRDGDVVIRMETKGGHRGNNARHGRFLLSMLRVGDA